MLNRVGNGCVFSVALLTLLILFLCGLEFVVDEPGRQERLNRELSLRRAWPTTFGRIESSQVELRKMRRMAGKQEHPLVVYKYAVNGTAYRSSNLGILGEEDDWRGDGAQGIVSRFPLGSQVSVHYDAGQPGQAYLLDTVGQATPSRGGWAFVVVSLLGFGLVLRLWRDRV